MLLSYISSIHGDCVLVNNHISDVILGQPGIAGPKGRIGEIGPAGQVGQPGPDGQLGQPGSQGLRGGPGSAGSMGATGATGTPGFTGGAGDTGLRYCSLRWRHLILCGYCNVRYSSVVRPSVRLFLSFVHPAKAIGRNEMPFSRETRVATSSG